MTPPDEIFSKVRICDVKSQLRSGYHCKELVSAVRQPFEHKIKIVHCFSSIKSSLIELDISFPILIPRFLLFCARGLAMLLFARLHWTLVSLVCLGL